MVAVESNLGASVNPGFPNADPTAVGADEVLAELRARRRPRLFVISGPSGVGKDTVIERLRPVFPEIHFAVTATTRARRPGEIDGVHYFFMDRSTFESHRANDEFMEWAVVYDNLYGVPRGPVRHALARGQDVIVKVDVQGAATIRRLVPKGTYIFLAPGSMAELLSRLKSRKSDDPDVLMERYGAATREIAVAPSFDYVVFNESDRLDQAIERIRAIVAAERSRVEQPEIAL